MWIPIFKYFGLPGLGFVVGYWLASDGSLKGKIEPLWAGVLGAIAGLILGLLILGPVG